MLVVRWRQERSISRLPERERYEGRFICNSSPSYAVNQVFDRHLRVPEYVQASRAGRGRIVLALASSEKVNIPVNLTFAMIYTNFYFKRHHITKYCLLRMQE